MSRLLGILLLLYSISFSPLAGWAEPKRAVLIVWDSSDAAVSQTHQKMASQLKALRAQGRLARVSNLVYPIQVYDFHKSAHAESLRQLGLSRASDCPYVAVVALGPDNIPTKVLWGSLYSNSADGIKAVGQYLGFDPQAVAADFKVNPAVDAGGKLPVGGNGHSLVWEKQSVAEGPAWLKSRDLLVNHQFKFFYSVEPQAKFSDVDEWAAPFIDELNFDTLISHALGRHWKVLPEIDTQKNDTRMLLGWSDKEGRHAWVDLWREHDGWHFATISGKEGHFADNSEYELRWAVDDVKVKLLMISPAKGDTPKEGWTKNHIIYEFTLTHS